MFLVVSAILFQLASKSEADYWNSFLIFFFSFLIKTENLLSSEDCGHDLASTQNLLKKHQLVEADITAHQVSNAVLFDELKSFCGKSRHVLEARDYFYFLMIRTM